MSLIYDRAFFISTVYHGGSMLDCGVSFSWKYTFVIGKSRYTNEFKKFIANKVPEATILNCAKTLGITYSTVKRIYKNYIDCIVPKLQKLVISESNNTNKLVLGIDDFAIRKGHTYDTGIHDLRNGILLEIIAGRKLDELRNHKSINPQLFELKPFAVVTDLAPYYKFAKEVYTDAIPLQIGFMLIAMQWMRLEE